MSRPPAPDHAVTIEPAVAVQADGTVLVRRSGKAPLRFQGRLVARAEALAGAASGCRLAVVARARGGLVVSVHILDPLDRHGGPKVAHDAPDSDAVAAYLERYDPAPDVAVRARPHRAGASPAAVALGAVGLRQRIDAARRDYAAAMTDALEQIAPAQAA